MTEEKRKERERAFIEKAIEIQHGKYSYDHFVYVNNITKGLITCPIHGDFLQTPKNHLQGQGCPICGKEYAKNCRKNNFEKFLTTAKERFKNNFSYPYIEEEYENSHSKITIRCNTCGNTFVKIACDHITSPNGGCNVCYKKSFEKYYSYEELLKHNILGLNIKPFEGKKEYRDKCIVICPKHGEYEVIINTILKGKGKCKKCTGRNVKDVELFKQTFIQKYGNELYCNFDEYINMYTEITFTCKRCGYIFKRKPTVILSWDYKLVCPKCSKDLQTIEKTKTTEEFKTIVEDIYGKDVFDTSESVYIKSTEPITLKCNKCGRQITRPASYFLRGHGCPYHGFNKSKAEKEISYFISSLGETIENGNKTVLNNHNELDIYLPDKQLAIEYDGLYWHNELNKDKYYHLNKTKECEKKGIRLIHIFEDEWLNKKEIWKSMLNNFLYKTENRIFARNCKINMVNQKDAKDFLNNNHLQGYCNSSYRIGLYYNEELVSLMTFGKTRHFIGNSSHEYELLRFCNKLNTTVVGGSSKLLKYFINNYNPSSIVSYADKRWSNGKLYEKLGFIKYNESPPNYYYIIGNQRKNRFNFRKSVLIKKYNCPSNITEHEFCLQQKWYRIYDCGCLCYEWKNNN